MPRHPTTPVPETERPAWFDAKLLQYQPGLYRLAQKHTTSKAACEDLYQDTLLRILSNWYKFREDGGFWLWMRWQFFAALKWRAPKRTGKHSSHVSVDGALADAATRGDGAVDKVLVALRMVTEPTALDDVNDTIERERVLSVLDGIHPQQARAVRLLFDGRSPKEISDIMQVSRQWVDQLLARSAEEIRSKIESDTALRWMLDADA